MIVRSTGIPVTAHVGGGHDRHLPTGRPIHLTEITIVCREDHIIVEEWNEVDVAGMLP